MTPTQRAAMEQALSALEIADNRDGVYSWRPEIDALSAALAEPAPVQEPAKKGLFVDLIAQHPGLAENLMAIDALPLPEWKPPPQLTDADVNKIYNKWVMGDRDGTTFTDAIQTAVRKQFGVNVEAAPQASGSVLTNASAQQPAPVQEPTDVQLELPEGNTLAHIHQDGWIAVRKYARAVLTQFLSPQAQQPAPPADVPMLTDDELMQMFTSQKTAQREMKFASAIILAVAEFWHTDNKTAARWITERAAEIETLKG